MASNTAKEIFNWVLVQGLPMLFLRYNTVVFISRIVKKNYIPNYMCLPGKNKVGKLPNFSLFSPGIQQKTLKCLSHTLYLL